MNILLLTNCIKQPDDPSNDITNIVFYFAKEWVRQGHRVIIIDNENKFPFFFYLIPKFVFGLLNRFGNFTYLSKTSRKEKQWEDSGVAIFRLPIKKAFPHAKFSAKRCKIQCAKICNILSVNSFVPDIITGHWLFPQLDIIYELSKEFKNAKTGLVIHGNLPENMGNAIWDKLKSIKTIFFRNEFTKRVMVDRYGDCLKQSQIKVCYSGVPSSFLNYKKKRTDWVDNGVFRLVYVGRLVKYKNVDCTIKALIKAFPDKKFVFDIIGDGPEMKTLKKLAKRNSIHDKVIFHGKVPREKIPTILNSSHCFVMTSDNEVFGLAYLEAMSCGCITVASKNGGVDGIIKNGVNGFLCKQGCVEELAELLSSIRKLDKSKACIIRNKAYESVIDYTDEAVAKTYLDNLSLN